MDKDACNTESVQSRQMKDMKKLGAVGDKVIQGYALSLISLSNEL